MKRSKNKEKIISFSDLERILKDKPDILEKINKEASSIEEKTKLKFIQTCIKRNIIKIKLYKLDEEINKLEEYAGDIEGKIDLLMDELYDNIEDIDDDYVEKLENIATKLADTHKKELTLEQISKFVNLL